MKKAASILALAFLALGSVACVAPVAPVYPASGYDTTDAYNLGLTHGSQDRRAGRAHNPHINDPDDVPAAFRSSYCRGYVQGYANPYSHGVSGSK